MTNWIDPSLIETLKNRVKLEAIIAETEPLVGQGRFRRGQNHDSLVVNVEKQIYFWNSKSGKPGNVFTWLMLAHNWSFKEAVADVARRTGVSLEMDHKNPPRPPSPPRPLSPRTTRHLAPPPETWQLRGKEVVDRAQELLWSPAGRPGLAELHRRGLRDGTIHRARLGWNPGHIFDEPARWGFSGGRKVSVPRGLIIPWIIDDELWRIRVRRIGLDPDPKGTPYYSPRIYPQKSAITYPYDHEALYNAGALVTGKPAIILEGEFDCLSIDQAAGDLVTPVATGSVSGSRRLRWLARLARCSPVLIGFDADEAGDREARYWLQVLSEARRWRPFWDDANQMARDGVDLRAWITAGIPDPLAGRWPITVRWPASYPPQAMPPTWRYLADGRIEAVYYAHREMEFGLHTLGLVRTAMELGGVCAGAT